MYPPFDNNLTGSVLDTIIKLIPVCLQHGKKKTDKRTNNDLHTHTSKDRTRRTSLETEVELRCPGRVSSFCSTSGTRRVNLVIHPMISHE